MKIPWASFVLLILLTVLGIQAHNLEHDELRSRYHFQPAKNWMNDPNGPMYYKGYYHLFFQYNPLNASWGRIVWAHSVSNDLTNWFELDPVIRPTMKFDRYGCWSGSSTILPNGKPVIMYTGINNKVGDKNYEVQNVIYPRNASDPLLREWVKPDFNPVIVPDGSIDANKFRDPTTGWYADGHWRILVGALSGTSQGVAYVYRSRDFRRWTRMRNPLHSAPTGMWECPDFYPVNVDGRQSGLDTSVVSSPRVKHVLKNSLDLRRYDYYTIGTYDRVRESYMPDNPSGDVNHLRYDYGNFYASKSFYDPAKNRRVIWGWANESDTPANDLAKQWAGIQAIPRKVWLDPNRGQLMLWPVEEVEALRVEKPVFFKEKILSWGQQVEVVGLQTAQADVVVTFEVPRLALAGAEWLDPALALDAQKLCSLRGADVAGGVGPFGLWVLASPHLEERTAIFFRVFNVNSTSPKILMCSDPTRSSLTPNLYRPTFAGFVDTDITEGTISLRTLIDRSVVESFGAGGRTCILSRVYPSLARGDKARLHVFNNGKAPIKVAELTAWEMKSAVMNGAHF